MNPRLNKAFALLFFCGAISTTLLSAAHVVNHARLIKTGNKAIGELTTKKDSLSCYYEVPPGGFANTKDCLTLRLGLTLQLPEYKAKVDVYYDPDNPSKFVIDSPMELRFLPSILVGFSIFFIFTGMRSLGRLKWLRLPAKIKSAWNRYN